MEKVKHSGVRKLVEGYDYHRIDPEENEGRKYILVRPVVYWTRYGRSVTAWGGYRWDGATGAKDLNGSISHLIHDVLCDNHCFDDRSPLSNWQASQILKDILKEEGYGLRQFTWRWATFLLGGWGVKKKNGWFFSWKRR